MPRSFMDSENRTWVLECNYGMIGLVMAKTGVDLRQLQDNHEAVAIELDDPNKLKAIIGVMTEEKREAMNPPLSINELMKSLKTDAQHHAAVIAVYQSAFDFFQSLGPELNDALAKTIRAMESAEKQTKSRMRNFIDSGRMDQMLAILSDLNKLAEWLLAAQDATKFPEIAKAMEEATAAETTPSKRTTTFIRLIVERQLTLTPKSGDSPESSPSIPAPSLGDSST